MGFISVPLSRVPTTYSPGLPVYLSWWGSWEGKQSLQPRPHSQTRSRIGIAFGAGRKNEPPPPFNTIRTLFPSSTLFRLVRGGSLCAVPKTAAVETTRTKGNSDTTAEPRTRTHQTPSPTYHHHQRQPFATPIYEQTSGETTTENREDGVQNNTWRSGHHNTYRFIRVACEAWDHSSARGPHGVVRDPRSVSAVPVAHPRKRKKKKQENVCTSISKSIDSGNRFDVNYCLW